jgi:outer membrane protein assembly factor BamB
MPQKPPAAFTLAEASARMNAPAARLDLHEIVPFDAPFETPPLTLPVVAGRTLLYAAPGRIVGADALSGEPLWAAEWTFATCARRMQTGPDDQTVAVTHDLGLLRALSTSDGTPAWTTRLPEDHAFAAHNRYAREGTRLFAAVERAHPYRQSALLTLDARTGERLRSAVATAPAHDLHAAGGHLLAIESLPDLRPGGGSTVLVARDPDTLVTRWRLVVPDRGTAEGGRIAASGARAWFGSTDGQGFVGCADLDTGVLLWRVDGLHGHDLTLCPDAHRLFVQTGTRIVALDARSGRRLWKAEMDEPSSGTVCCARGVVYHGRGDWLYALDADSGRTLAVAESRYGRGGAAWSDGTRVYWMTEGALQVHSAAQP